MMSNGSEIVLSSSSVKLVRTVGRCWPASLNVAIFVHSMSSVFRAYVPDGVLYTCNDVMVTGCCGPHILYLIITFLIVAMTNEKQRDGRTSTWERWDGHGKSGKCNC